jgi:uncharacterized lipoprotein YddW (UPF0748 family)
MTGASPAVGQNAGMGRSRSLAALLAVLALVAGCGGNGAHKASPKAAACPVVADKTRQVRAMWIATVENTDWPARPGESVAEQQAGYVKLLDRAKALNFNTVYVQIRPEADAFYPSPYEPWSRYLTGTQGRDPGYDPLAFLVAQAHARGLEFHAWFNPYRVSTQSDPGKLAADGPARRNPGWVHRYGDALWYDPGLPQVRQLVTNVILDVVRKYDIDGVHLDDYFYPYPVPGQNFPDQATYKKYGAGYKNIGDWRRHNIDTLVQGLDRTIHQAKPWVKFGISPFGVWRNHSSDANGSNTQALQSYDDIYADTRGWIKNGWLDYVAPQLYWPIGLHAADYTTLVAWWSKQVAGTQVQLVIGQAAYQVGTSGPWKNPAELTRHLAVNTRYPAVAGDAFFSARDLVADRGGFAARLRAGPFAHPALPPLMPRLGGRAPAAPSSVTVRTISYDSDTVSWHGSASAYAVYRVAGRGPHCMVGSGRVLVATVSGATRSVNDTTVKSGGTYTYYVTALDRLHHESSATPATTFTVSGG